MGKISNKYHEVFFFFKDDATIVRLTLVGLAKAKAHDQGIGRAKNGNLDKLVRVPHP